MSYSTELMILPKIREERILAFRKELEYARETISKIRKLEDEQKLGFSRQTDLELSRLKNLLHDSDIYEQDIAWLEKLECDDKGILSYPRDRKMFTIPIRFVQFICYFAKEGCKFRFRTTRESYGKKYRKIYQYAFHKRRACPETVLQDEEIGDDDYTDSDNEDNSDEDES